MKIIDWQAQFTEHQVHTWRALQPLLTEDIIHVVAQKNSEIRRRQGWTDIETSDLHIIVFNKKTWWSQGKKIIQHHKDAIHVFGGFWADRRFFALILYAVFMNCKLVIMNESYATRAVSYLNQGNKVVNQLKVKLRPWLYRAASFLIHSLTNRKNVCLLALSTNAVNQFIRAGFSEQQVFPFGYFVPAIEHNQLSLSDAISIKLIFIGNLHERKGIDIAVTAMQQLHNEAVDVSLDIYGVGDADNFIPENSDSIHYKGVIPFGHAQTIISQYHTLVLPSRHDGWGVVVNEALLQGVPVIVSDCVGAKCLIENIKAGLIFECENSDDLALKIRSFCIDNQLRNEITLNAQSLAQKITPEKAAEYMNKVFSYYFSDQGMKRPNAIWTNQI
jgi:glycosyltransferase involved in cell wall biosynthesis